MSDEYPDEEEEEAEVDEEAAEEEEEEERSRPNTGPIPCNHSKVHKKQI